MSTILVTGVNGFVGHHLARELCGEGHEVIGTGKDGTLSPDLNDYVKTYVGNCDLTDASAVKNLPLGSIDAVINLAGLAQVGASFGPGQAERYNHINVAVHTVIATELSKIGKQGTRIVAVSTGAVYNNTQPMPITEDGKLIEDGSPYALSKIAMEQAMEEYRRGGQDVVIVRPFNHIGPGQLGGFLVPDLIQKLQNLGADSTLKIGRLDTKRDFTDVRDVARAYRLLATTEKLNYGLYNVCSGTSRSGQEILDISCKILGIDTPGIELDPSRIRPNDPLDIFGDSSRLQSDTGWKPSISLEQTLKDTIKNI